MPFSKFGLMVARTLVFVVFLLLTHLQFPVISGSVAHAQVGNDGLTDFERTRLERTRSSCSRGSDIDCGRLGTLQKEAAAKRRSHKDAQKRFADLGRACDAGDPAKCYEWGRYREIEESKGPTSALTRSIFEKSCPETNPSLAGCSRLAQIYYRGEGGPQDKVAARAVYTKACGLGHIPSCTSVGFMHNKGEGGPEDKDKAYNYYTMACDGGEKRACTTAAVILEQIGPRESARTALASFIEACANGRIDANGCFMAAELYSSKDDPSFNQTEAVKYFEYACNLAHERGCYLAGYMHDLGTGTPEDDVKAFAYFEKACGGFSRNLSDIFGNLGNQGNLRLGDQQACVRLSEMFLNGEGTAQNPGLALKVADGSCQQRKNYESCQMAGRIYIDTEFMRRPTVETLNAVEQRFEAACKARGTPTRDCWSDELHKRLLFCSVLNEKACSTITTVRNVAKQACDFDRPVRTVNACFNTAMFYDLDPRGDYSVEALAYFRKSCDAGESAGCVAVTEREDAQ